MTMTVHVHMGIINWLNPMILGHKTMTCLAATLNNCAVRLAKTHPYKMSEQTMVGSHKLIKWL